MYSRERAGSDIEEQPEELEHTPGEKSVEKAFTLAIPYAANIGGTAFLTGTPPNLVVKSQVERYELVKGCMVWSCLGVVWSCRGGSMDS